MATRALPALALRSGAGRARRPRSGAAPLGRGDARGRALTDDQVDVIAKVTSPRFARLIEAHGGSVTGVGEVLARFAVEHQHEDLSRLVHRLYERLDQDGPDPDPTVERFLSFATHADGSVTGHLHLDALGAEKFQAALEAHLQADRPSGDTRTRAQQLADPITGKGTAALGFGGIVSAARARQVACDAELRRYLLSADGELLDEGRRPRCRGPRRACEAWGAAGSFPSPAAAHPPSGARSTT